MSFRLPPGLLIAASLVVAFVLGAFSYKENLHPLSYIRPYSALGAYDELGRLVSHLHKIKMACPAQDARTGVILAIGQSNSANHGETYSDLEHPDAITNYWAGECYDGLPPLLGATGEAGSFLPLLADKLISQGVYDRVVIVSSGVDGSNIARWGAAGDLNGMLSDVLGGATRFKITDVVWHQGESDFIYHTPQDEYERQFSGLLGTLRERGVDAPAYLAVASRCDKTNYLAGLWRASNPVATAQRNIVDKGLAILGADTDSMLANEHKRLDHCHLNLKGERAVAGAFAESIKQHHKATARRARLGGVSLE